VLPVQVTRSNYDGPIELALDPQPGPLRLEGNVIPAGATIGLVTISADETSPGALVARLVGRAVDARPEVLRTAQVGDFPGGRYQPRLRSELGLAVTVAVPFRIAWLPGENDRLFLGGKLPARLQFTRTSGAEGKIRVRLVSSHPMPKKTIRQGMQQRIVDDPDRTLRLEGEPAFGPDQTEATVNILVPSDLPKQPWDVVLIGELLTKDGKSVVSSLATPVRKLEPIAPFSLVLTGPEKAEGKAGGGSAGKLTGKIARSPGYKQPVLVTLDKLPQGYFPPQVLVPGDRNEFELPLSFGNASPPGELKGVEVVALAAPATPKSVRSNAVAVAIEVTPGEKRPTEPPKVIFEDEEKFAEMLVEGTGRAIPDQRDKYSGTYSLRVTPDQKSNPQLAGLTVKIREHPGPGEYRYLRFAWRKLQGNSICLQLAHDGKFGPGGGREGATFRYHAGPGEECFDGSLLVSDKVPARFEVVTRDLFLDFGEFTLTGIGFAPVDGQAALFDHIYLARHPDDFDQLAPGKAE
jgi:hypothetical protein